MEKETNQVDNVCYECGKDDCQDFISGNAPSKKQVSDTINDIINTPLEERTAKAMTAAELSEWVRSL